MLFKKFIVTQKADLTLTSLIGLTDHQTKQVIGLRRTQVKLFLMLQLVMIWLEKSKLNQFRREKSHVGENTRQRGVMHYCKKTSPYDSILVHKIVHTWANVVQTFYMIGACISHWHNTPGERFLDHSTAISHQV